MKVICFLFMLTTSLAYAQVSPFSQRDSIPAILPPDLMPNARPNNSFYRYPMGQRNRMQASIDRMPIKIPDSSMNFIIHLKHLKPNQRMYYWNPGSQTVPRKHR